MSEWKNMDNWYAVLPPSRPTIEELNRIKAYLQNMNRDESIAIMGSTPEFRELVARMGFKNRFIFDKSISFYHRMSDLIPDRTTYGEHLVIGDWKDSFKRYSNEFGVVLSDLTMGNIDYNDRAILYSRVANSIRNGGVFIDKVLAFDFSIPSLNSLFAKYEQLPINLRTINDFSSEVLFCSELVVRKNIVDSTAFYSAIRNSNCSEKILFFAEAAHMITPEDFIWYYGKQWNELSDDYSKYYSKQKIFIEEDKSSPYFHRTKQFFNIK